MARESTHRAAGAGRPPVPGSVCGPRPWGPAGRLPAAVCRALGLSAAWWVICGAARLYRASRFLVRITLWRASISVAVSSRQTSDRRCAPQRPLTPMTDGPGPPTDPPPPCVCATLRAPRTFTDHGGDRPLEARRRRTRRTVSGARHVPLPL